MFQPSTPFIHRMFMLYSQSPQRVPKNPKVKLKMERVRKEVGVVKKRILMQNIEGKIRSLEGEIPVQYSWG
jgi:hypothetical protein